MDKVVGVRLTEKEISWLERKILVMDVGSRNMSGAIRYYINKAIDDEEQEERNMQDYASEFR